MKRREFLLLTGATGIAAVVDPMLGHVTSTGNSAPEVLPGIETFVMTTCLMCPGGCGIKVRRLDGDPTSIAGNPKHPVNAGGVCTEGMSALQMLYHPDRLTRPMKQTGRKGSDEFKPITWDEALDTISESMKKLESRKAPEKCAFVLGRTGGSMADLVYHFMERWGSPNVLLDQPGDGYPQVFQAMHGLKAHPAFDFDNADFVLSFGADLLNAWESPLQFQRSYTSFHSAGRGVRATLAVADVRFSRTAGQASEWVGVAPGSYGALALGIAYVMLRERQYDFSFAEEHLYGFNDEEERSDKGTRLGYRSLVLRDYSPEVVSRLTGVPVETIINLGKSFGESPRALAIFDENVTAQPGGMYAGMAIHSLNLLKGNLNRAGGIYLQPGVPLAPLGPAPARDALAIEDLPSLASNGGLEIAFLYYSNPTYSSAFRSQIRSALERIGMVVSFSPFLDETSRYADFILPDALPLERWEDRPFPPSSPIAGWGVVQPCVRAAGETRHAGDVMLSLAQHLGGRMATGLPWKSFEEILKHRARGLYESRAGSPCGDSFDQELLGEMESRGWWMSSYGSFDDFWQKLTAAGAWADPHFQVKSLYDYIGSPDGRIDLYSRELQKRLGRSGSAVSEIDFLPHYHSEGIPIGVTDLPLMLNIYRPGKLQGGSAGSLPWARLAAIPLDRLAGDPWAEVSPKDSQQYSIGDLDWVWIESASGKIKVRAVISPACAAGVVNLPYGLGSIGRHGKERGVNPLELISPERDPLSGLAYRLGTKVKIYRA
ncbi:MAG TPA: molybdopterin-dependent oxidoreductase [Acidobacteriota bacterium]|nr:molybdopterin-dependent oxidoreductase [Acidobacteriota bacterium]